AGHVDALVVVQLELEDPGALAHPGGLGGHDEVPTPRGPQAVERDVGVDEVPPLGHGRGLRRGEVEEHAEDAETDVAVAVEQHRPHGQADAPPVAPPVGLDADAGEDVPGDVDAPVVGGAGRGRARLGGRSRGGAHAPHARGGTSAATNPDGPRRGGQAVGSWWSAKRSRRSFLENLPTLVFGISSMKTTSSGSHHLATLSARYSRSASLVSSSHSRTTTQASGRSAHFGWGTPITAASATAGWPMISFSRSTDEIHSPPDLMTSLVRSTRRM